MRCAAFLVAAILAAAAARADEPPQARVRALSDELQIEYDLAHYDKALKLAEELYRLKPTPGVLFNVAQCHRKLGQFKEAANLYRSFLSRAEPGSSEAIKAKELLGQVEALIKQQEEVAKAPPQGTSPLPAGPAKAPAPPAAVPSVVYVPQPAPPPSHKAAYVLGATAVAALGAGAFFGLGARSAANDLTGTMHNNADANSLADKLDKDAHIADLLFALGGVLALATVIAW